MSGYVTVVDFRFEPGPRSKQRIKCLYARLGVLLEIRLQWQRSPFITCLSGQMAWMILMHEISHSKVLSACFHSSLQAGDIT